MKRKVLLLEQTHNYTCCSVNLCKYHPKSVEKCKTWSYQKHSLWLPAVAK